MSMKENYRCIITLIICVKMEVKISKMRSYFKLESTKTVPHHTNQ